MNTLHNAIELLENGEWEAAHKIVQTDDSATGAWAHGIVHMKNAGYWYGRAGRELAVGAQIQDEITALKASIVDD